MSSSTIQSLFPYKGIRGDDFTITPCYCEFSAPVVGGKYVFNHDLTPPVEFSKLLQGQKGIIAGVMISANCTDAEFAAAVDSPLLLQVLHGENNTPITMGPYPFTQFSQGGEYQAQWQITAASMLQEENVKLSLTGAVNQIGGLGLNELVIRISFNYYRVGVDSVSGKILTGRG